MNNKLSPLANFMHGLTRFYYELRLANKEAGQYKIDDIILNELGEEPVIIVQARNKNISYPLKIMDVMSNNQVLNQFSRQDIKTIVYIACEYKNRPKVKIENLSFCGKIKKIVFSLAQGSRQNIQNKTASEIVNDKETIAVMSSNDAVKVGYTAGTELFNDQQTQMDQLKE